MTGQLYPTWLRPLGRGYYAFWGVLLLALKYNLDRWIAWRGYGVSWFPWHYLAPERAIGATADASNLAATLLLTSVPFIAIGLWLTWRRLRDIGLSGALLPLFFVPFLNVWFFIVLCVWAHRRGEPAEARVLNRVSSSLAGLRPFAMAAVTVAVTAGVSLPLVAFCTLVLQDYGWGLFVGVPFLMGLLSSVLDGLPARRSFGRACGVAALSVVVTGLLCVAVAIEGVICVLMAAPLALILVLVGAVVGWSMQAEHWRRVRGEATRVYAVGGLSLPVLMVLESQINAPPSVRPVTTVIEIAAPPQRVWDHVVSFAELPPPAEWWFTAGIAYPIRARIEGEGVGAIRYCEFSTGAFVEPITVFDPPLQLGFDVVEQPAPLREWTPYSSIEPAHLDGFFRSRRGEFRLIPLDDGRSTRLEGTTWYEHRLWPSAYWRPWSDYLIHTIHDRVLSHIKTLAEAS